MGKTWGGLGPFVTLYNTGFFFFGRHLIVSDPKSREPESSSPGVVIRKNLDKIPVSFRRTYTLDIQR